MIEEKRINELQGRSHKKMQKELEKENGAFQNKKGFRQLGEMVKRFPELLNIKAVDPKRTLS